ncbi:hypothetical protein SELMODRAFT_405953 [Selaginella moellendorffii]|uniref:protein-serine/threonine phosphatase n=1 Tax=Selaginella moellendorffii TaxID=88036 RepID=D8R069_SELML|nr:hypothetical protein SELMODRAFT_405953 [Selaginella moellendorffii]
MKPLLCALFMVSSLYLCYVFLFGELASQNGLKDINFSVDGKNSWSYGTAGSTGHRSKQEDRVLVVSSHADFGVFGVFDGHGSSGASDFAANTFYPVFSRRIAEGQRLGEALQMAIEDVENMFMEKAHKQAWYSGSTACIAVVTPQVAIVGSVGDSRALVCVARKNSTTNLIEMDSTQLSKDHHPELAEERRRIEAAGGFVEFGGVNGELAVSRVIGDMEFKAFGVSAQANVVEYRIENSNEEFLVLASDGIFQRMSNQDVCNTVIIARGSRALDHESRSGLSQVAAVMIVEDALESGSSDNLSVIVVPLVGER